MVKWHNRLVKINLPAWYKQFKTPRVSLKDLKSFQLKYSTRWKYQTWFELMTIEPSNLNKVSPEESRRNMSSNKGNCELWSFCTESATKLVTFYFIYYTSFFRILYLDRKIKFWELLCGCCFVMYEFRQHLVYTHFQWKTLENIIFSVVEFADWLWMICVKDPRDGGGGTQQSFVWRRLQPRSKPLPFSSPEPPDPLSRRGLGTRTRLRRLRGTGGSGHENEPLPFCRPFLTKDPFM